MNETTIKLSQNNLFWNLTSKEMRNCFDGLLDFYNVGYLSEQNPLTAYAEKYKERYNTPGVHLIQMEHDLLFAMAYHSYISARLKEDFSFDR